MKYIISICTILVITMGSLYAGEDHNSSSNSGFKEVQKLDMDFEVKLNDDGKTVTASWDDFPSGEGFLWYKLMYSTTNSTPVYPDQNAVFVGTNRTDVENSFKLKYGKNHYIRLCVVTEEENQKGRYCSEVKKIEANTTGAVKSFVAKKTTTAVEKKQSNVSVKKVELTTRLKERVDAMLEKFMDRLESKGYSDEKKLAAIDRIIDKMEALKEKNPRYERLVSYMIEKLQEYANQLDDGIDALEEIFNEF